MDIEEIFKAHLFEGCTVGLAGVGKLGSKLRVLAETMGCQVILCDPPRNFAEADELSQHFFELWGNGMGGCQVSNEGMEVFVPLEALARADVISIQVPLTNTPPYPTKGMINTDFLARLKPEAKLLCFSSPEVITPDARNDRRISIISA